MSAGVQAFTKILLSLSTYGGGPLAVLSAGLGGSVSAFTSSKSAVVWFWSKTRELQVLQNSRGACFLDHPHVSDAVKLASSKRAEARNLWLRF